MDDAQLPISEQLLAEMGWVRQLARALVRDDVQADDLVQDTWLVAAECQPDTDQPVRPWLARVVKNLVHTRRRNARVAAVKSAPDGTFDFGVQPAVRFMVSAAADRGRRFGPDPELIDTTASATAFCWLSYRPVYGMQTRVHWLQGHDEPQSKPASPHAQ